MTIGTVTYVADHAPVVAQGATLGDDELDAALGGPVSAILWDDVGHAAVEVLLAKLVETDFEAERLREVLSQEPSVEDWRVGEALAEAYLTEHRECKFPWPTGRDLKNPTASPAGTDLVGFQQSGGVEEQTVRFAFGEVKTSSEQAWPPSVTQGRHGLVQQIENLRDNPQVRAALVMYLAHHALLDAPWRPMYLRATKRYFQNPADIALFGILVRDVTPNEGDLRSRARALANGCPPGTSIELRAIYLPTGAITGLPDRARIARGRR